MNAIYVVMMKELLDLARDRRTVLISLLAGPVLIVLLIVGMGSVMHKKMTTQMDKALDVPVIGAQYAPNLIAWLQTQNINIKDAPEDPEGVIARQDENLVLRISSDFADDWRASAPALVEILYDSTRDDARIPFSRLNNVLNTYAQQVGSLRLLARGVNPAVGMPIVVAGTDLSTPKSRVGQALAFLPYLLIMSAFIGGAYLVIDITAGERERQSLEPLLATPTSREAIMSGKILAATAFGIFGLVLMLVGFKVAFLIAPSGVKVDVSLLAMAKLLLILVPMLLIGNCLLTLIAASVKSVKEAQSYMSLLILLPMLPTFYLMISPVKNQLWMFVVPFLAQNQMIMMVLRSETIEWLQWATYFGAGLGLAGLLWVFAAGMYHKEKLAVSG